MTTLQVSRELVECLVVEKVREILGRHDIKIDVNAYLVSDLNIASDDLSFVFVPDLERILNVSGTQEDWQNVHRVEDAIQLLLKLATKPA